MLKEVLKIMFGMIFTQNYVLVQFIAICPFLGVSKKFDSCIGMSGAVIFVMTLASAVTHLIYQYVMVYKSLGVYLPLITTNCAVLAVTLLNVSNGYTAMGGGLLFSCVNGFSAGVGFGLALILFCGVRKALEHAKPPKCFEGLPITLVAAALTSMTFMGFAGMADKLFG